MGKRISAILTSLLTISHLVPQLLCQSKNDPGGTNRALATRTLIQAVQAEQQTGTYLLYAQHYVDTENQYVSYRGSISGFIKSAKLNGCLLTIDFIIADRFSGFVAKKGTGTLEDDELYSTAFTLTPNLAHSLSLIEAPPAEVADGTNSICVKNPSCDFAWLAVQAKGMPIRETKTTNDWVDSNGNVSRSFIPVSSLEAGKQLIKELQIFTNNRCQQASIPSNAVHKTTIH